MTTVSEKLCVPVIPIKNTTLFPHLFLPIVVSRPSSKNAIESAVASEDKIIGIFVQKDAAIAKPGKSDLYQTGTLAVIKKMAQLNDLVHIAVQGIERIKLINTADKKNYYNVYRLPEPVDTNAEIEALHRANLDLVAKMANLVQPEVQVDINYIISAVNKPLNQAYLISSLLSLSIEKETRILQANTQIEVFQLVHDHLMHEIQVLQLKNRIANRTQSEMTKQQQDYMLRQQLQAIQEELGDNTPEQADIVELKKRQEKTKLPEQVSKELKKELARLAHLTSMSSEYQLIRNYVDFVLELPWYAATDDNLDLNQAQRILDADHYGLNDVKQRIIEHLAVMKLNPQAKSPILCFVGPPGVGKTSVGQSIARALGRKFERISLGGLHDEAELRGHRRTYIGAMPGRILRAIRRTGVNNPVLMLDEIDKLGADFRGDPAAALMEVLDPEQNKEFHDNFLDIPFDLANVFFITTANTLDSIPSPLLDRMEILRLPGYSEEEKKKIAQVYLIERQLKENGLTAKQLSISEEVIAYVVRQYTREAGVRELERQIGRIARKVATQIARKQKRIVNVLPEQLNELLGTEHYYTDQLRKTLPPGVAAGLAWTEAGGQLLYVEAVILPGKKDLTLTGQLGEIMQESAITAQSYIWSHADTLGIDKKLIRTTGAHIHIPEGAVPKDGPSAGVT
ncbi:MAG: endopeptidase La, partial [Thiohalomonadales bacterium]